MNTVLQTGAQESLGATAPETCECVELLGQALRLRCDPAEVFWRRELLAACERQGADVGSPATADAVEREFAALGGGADAAAAVRDASWEHLPTIVAAQRLATALEFRAANHPFVHLDEEVSAELCIRRPSLFRYVS